MKCTFLKLKLQFLLTCLLPFFLPLFHTSMGCFLSCLRTHNDDEHLLPTSHHNYGVIFLFFGISRYMLSFFSFSLIESSEICVVGNVESSFCFVKEDIPIEVEQSILEDLRNRVQLSSVAPPSVSFYMFLNTHNGLSCSSISHDGSLVAGGFSDSVLKIFSGYGICQSLDNRLSIKGERRKNILEFSRAFLVILVGSPFFPFLSSQVGGEDYVRAIFLGLWGSVNLLSSFLCSILSVQAPQVAAAVCDFLHASLSSSSLGIHYCNGVVLVMWSIICQCFTR